MDIKTRAFLRWCISELCHNSVFICFSSLLVALIVLISTRNQPPIYATTTKVIYGNGGNGSLGSNIGFVAQTFGIPLTRQTGAISGLLLQEILKSETMKKDVIEKFNLTSYFNVPNNYLASLRLEKVVRIINFDLKSIISIRVQFKDPKLAAEVANFYIENLLEMNKKLKLTTNKDIVQVLDPAEVPLYKIGPSPRKNTISSLIGTFLLTSFIVLISSIWCKKNKLPVSL